MPHSVSAKKRLRQNVRNRERNRAAKSEIKTVIRKLLGALSAGDAKEAQDHLRAVASKVDQAAAGRIIHPNRAARIKSRLSARIVTLAKGSAPSA